MTCKKMCKMCKNVSPTFEAELLLLVRHKEEDGEKNKGDQQSDYHTDHCRHRDRIWKNKIKKLIFIVF